MLIIVTLLTVWEKKIYIISLLITSLLMFRVKFMFTNLRPSGNKIRSSRGGSKEHAQ
jgi:hypothetical protein